MGSDVSDNGSFQNGNILATVSLAAGERSPVHGSPDRLRRKIATLEESMTALQSDLTAAYKLNHYLVCSPSLVTLLGNYYLVCSPSLVALLRERMTQRT